MFACAAAALPSPAGADRLTIDPAALQAGGNPALVIDIGFSPATTDTPQTIVATLAAGLMLNPNSEHECLALEQLTTACEIGNSSLTALQSSTGLAGSGTLSAAPGTLYLVPAHRGDLAGIEQVAAGLANQYIGLSLRPGPDGGLDMTTTMPDTRPTLVLGLTLTFGGVLGTQPPIRLPTACAAATSTLAVSYYSGTPATRSLSTFRPVGCGRLRYAPRVSALVTERHRHTAPGFKATLTQRAGQSATRVLTLTLPRSLRIDARACATARPCRIGSAGATSPWLPSRALRRGVVTLAGPRLTVTFPPPVPLVLAGELDLAKRLLAFPAVPDVPLSTLTVGLSGPHVSVTTCPRELLSGRLTPQDGGPPRDLRVPLASSGCAHGRR